MTSTFRNANLKTCMMYRSLKTFASDPCHVIREHCLALLTVESSGKYHTLLRQFESVKSSVLGTRLARAFKRFLLSSVWHCPLSAPVCTVLDDRSIL